LIVTCKHCSYSWDYKGNSTVPSCPKCNYKVFITKLKSSEVQEQEKTSIDHQTIRIKTEKDRIHVIPLGDIHIGAPKGAVEYEKLRGHLDYILKNEDFYMLGMGDYHDFCTKMGKGPNVFQASLSPQEQIEKVVNLFEPLAKKGKILGLHRGNHEVWVSQEVGIDVTANLARELKVSYLGDAAYTKIIVNDKEYVIYSLHGVPSSNPKFPHSKLKALFDAMKGIIDADVYLMGHVHSRQNDPAVGRSTFQGIRKAIYSCTGHFLNWTHSYAKAFGYSPDIAGVVNIKLFADRWDIHLSG